MSATLPFLRSSRPKRFEREEIPKLMKRLISLTLILSIYCGLIAPITSRMAFEANAQTTPGKTRLTNMTDIPNGLKFRLSEGEAGAETREKQLPAKTDPLSENQTSNLLKRIPAIKEQTDDKTDFAKRVGVLPADAESFGRIVSVFGVGGAADSVR